MYKYLFRIPIDDDEDQPPQEAHPMNKIIFKIPGEPVGKGRPKFGRLKGGGVSVRTPEKTINFENLVKISFDETGAEPFSSSAQISATITAYFQPPKSASKKKLAQMTTGELRPTKKPDADNIAKAVLDALNGLAYHDDAQVVELHVSKAYAEQAHTIVQLQEIQPASILLKSAKWTEDQEGFYICGACNEPNDWPRLYCPNCGALMT